MRSEAVPAPSDDRASGIVPRRIGPYVLEATLGSGGFGSVHRALDERSGERVALKVLHRRVAAEPELLRRFLNEARTTAVADNPHVVRVVDAHEELDGVACIAFELLEGETLEVHLRREGALPPNEAVDFAVQILDGLEVAHERGIVHRDLKPVNLFLVDDGLRTRCVKILDFGIGRLTDGSGPKLTATGASLGSPYYMAPEQLLDSARVDVRADVYAVGVCLYRMLAGSLPHGDVAVAMWMSFIAQGRAAPRVSSPREPLPAALVDALAIALAPKPEGRWQNAAAFSRALLDSLPGASAPTRVSYEPAAVLRAPVPALAPFASPPPRPQPEGQPNAGRSGRHAAIQFEAVSEPPRVSPVPRASPVPPRISSTPPVLAPIAPPIAMPSFAPPPEPAWRRPSPRTLVIAALVAGALFTFAMLIGGIGLAFVAGELVGRREAPASP